jgi:hypothetical protein
VAPPFDPVMAGADPDDGSRGANQRWPLAQRLMTLADLEYDPDAYIAAVHAGGPEDRHASEIAKRLIDAKRPAEALQWLEKPRRRGQEADNTDVDLRIAALAALEREDEVQALRWVTFEQMLSIGICVPISKGSRTSRISTPNRKRWRSRLATSWQTWRLSSWPAGRRWIVPRHSCGIGSPISTAAPTRRRGPPHRPWRKIPGRGNASLPALG